MTDPWAFGLTQLLTIFGFFITAVIAISGFRTFERWKREKLEERRMEVALDGLSIAYESTYVFGHIRSILTSPDELKEATSRFEGGTDAVRQKVGPFFVVIQRIRHYQDFFDRLWKLQPRCMAVMGASAESIFNLVHMARKEIEISVETLSGNAIDPPDEKTDHYRELLAQCRRNIWNQGEHEKEKDLVGKSLGEFRSRMEGLCRPIIDRNYGIVSQSGIFRRACNYLGI